MQESVQCRSAGLSGIARDGRIVISLPPVRLESIRIEGDKSNTLRRAFARNLHQGWKEFHLRAQMAADQAALLSGGTPLHPGALTFPVVPHLLAVGHQHVPVRGVDERKQVIAGALRRKSDLLSAFGDVFEQRIDGPGGSAPVLFADEDRAQRNTVALADVDYVIEANFVLTDQAGSVDNINKFVEMFERRVAKGQHFHQPYFGCREFVAEVLPADNPPPAIAEDRQLGIMLWDIAFGPKTNAAIFFDASLRQGVLGIPPDAKSALATLHAETGGAA